MKYSTVLLTRQIGTRALEKFKREVIRIGLYLDEGEIELELSESFPSELFPPWEYSIRAHYFRGLL